MSTGQHQKRANIQSGRQLERPKETQFVTYLYFRCIIYGIVCGNTSNHHRSYVCNCLKVSIELLCLILCRLYYIRSSRGRL